MRRYKLGSALARLKRLDEATDSLQKALQLMPYSAEAYQDLGWILQTRDKHEEALAYFEKALWLRRTLLRCATISVYLSSP